MKFCSEGGCTGIAVTGAFCELHVDPLKRATRNAPRHERDAWYTRKEWRGVYGVRGMKIRRNPMCEIAGCGKRATDVHHIDGSWKENGNWFLFLGGYDLENLQSLCKSCHARITMEEMQYGHTLEEGVIPCLKTQ